MKITSVAGRSEDEENAAIPAQVPDTPPITGNISTVTGPNVSPTIPTAAVMGAKNVLTTDLYKNLSPVLDDMLQGEDCYYNGELGLPQKVSQREE